MRAGADSGRPPALVGSLAPAPTRAMPGACVAKLADRGASSVVEGAGFEPTKRVARQIYSLLPLTTRPSLRGSLRMEPRRGLEPLTYRLQIGCAANCATRARGEPTRSPTQKRPAWADQEPSMRRRAAYCKEISLRDERGCGRTFAPSPGSAPPYGRSGRFRRIARPKSDILLPRGGWKPGDERV